MGDTRDIATPKRTAEIVQQYQLHAKKSLGQNFLTDANILTNMLAAAELTSQTNVIEVGPGIGALTQRLAREAQHVLAFEIDSRLLPVLADTLSPYANVTVVHQDVLRAPLSEVVATLPPAERLCVVANLPYYITTPIIMRFLESPLAVDCFVMMMQKEVAQRMTARQGTKAYGSLTIAIQYYMHAHIAFTVPRTVFQPQPNVDSAVLCLTRRAQPAVSVNDERQFFALVRAAFVQRRKTLWNNLQAAYGSTPAVKATLTDALAASQIAANSRAETLSMADFGALSDALVAQGLRLSDAD